VSQDTFLYVHLWLWKVLQRWWLPRLSRFLSEAGEEQETSRDKEKTFAKYAINEFNQIQSA